MSGSKKAPCACGLLPEIEGPHPVCCRLVWLEVPSGEFSAGAGFQIGLEPTGYSFAFKREIALQFPRAKLCGVGAFARIVLRKTVIQISGRAGVMASWVIFALEYIGAKHDWQNPRTGWLPKEVRRELSVNTLIRSTFEDAKAGMPSRSSGAATASPPSFHSSAAPSSPGFLLLEPERRLVEARGVEPLSGTPSTMVSTRLANDLGFRSGWARLRRCLS
jgi:hypothetical protein